MSQANLNGNSFDDNNGKNSKRSNVSVKRLVLNINKDKSRDDENVVNNSNNNYNEHIFGNFSQTFNPNLSNANLDYITNAIKEENYPSIPKLSYDNISKSSGKENIPYNSQNKIDITNVTEVIKNNEKDELINNSNKSNKVSQKSGIVDVNNHSQSKSKKQDVEISNSKGNSKSSKSQFNDNLTVEKQIHLSPPKSKQSNIQTFQSGAKSNLSNSKASHSKYSSEKVVPLEKPKSKKSYSEMKANIYGAYTETINDMFIILKHYDKNNSKWMLEIEDIVKDRLLFDQEVKNFTIKPVGGVGQFISRMWKFWILYHAYSLKKTKIPLNIFLREVRQSHQNILDNKFLFEENIVDLIQKNYSNDEIAKELNYLNNLNGDSNNIQIDDLSKEFNNEDFAIFFTHSVYEVTSEESQELLKENSSYSYFYNELDKVKDQIDTIYTNYLLKKPIWKNEIKEIHRLVFKVDYENYIISPKDIDCIENSKRYMSFYKFWILSFILMFEIVPICIQNIRKFFITFSDSLSKANCVSREFLIVFIKEVSNLISTETFSYEIDKLKKQLRTKEYVLSSDYHYEKVLNLSSEIKDFNANDWQSLLEIYSNLELNPDYQSYQEYSENNTSEDSKMNTINMIIDEYYNKFLINDFSWMNEFQNIIKYYFEWQQDKWCFKPRFLNNENNNDNQFNEDTFISMNLLKDYKFLLLVCFFHENQYETGIKLFLLFTYNLSSFYENFENFIINYPRVLLLLFHPNVILEELSFIQGKYLKIFSQNYQALDSEEVSVDYITIKDYITMLDPEYMNYIDITYKSDYVNSLMKQKRCMYNDQPKNINDNYISIIDTHIISSKKYFPEDIDEKHDDKKSIEKSAKNSINKFESKKKEVVSIENAEDKVASSKKKVLEEIENYNNNKFSNSNYSKKLKSENYTNMDIREFSSSKKKNSVNINGENITFSINSNSENTDLDENNTNSNSVIQISNRKNKSHIDPYSKYNTPHTISNYKISFGGEFPLDSNEDVKINIDLGDKLQNNLSEKSKKNEIMSQSHQKSSFENSSNSISNDKSIKNATPKINSTYKMINDPFSKFKKLLAPKKYPIDACSQINDESEDFEEISHAKLQLERSQNLKVNKIFNLDKDYIKDFPKDTHMYLTLLPNFVLKNIVNHIKEKLTNNSNQNSFYTPDENGVSIQNVDCFTLNILRKEFKKLSIENEENTVNPTINTSSKNDKKNKKSISKQKIISEDSKKSVNINDSTDNNIINENKIIETVNNNEENEPEIDVASYFKNKKKYKTKSRVKSKNFEEDISNVNESNKDNNYTNNENDNKFSSENRSQEKSNVRSRTKNKDKNNKNALNDSIQNNSEHETNKLFESNKADQDEIRPSTKNTKSNKYNKYKVSLFLKQKKSYVSLRSESNESSKSENASELYSNKNKSRNITKEKENDKNKLKDSKQVDNKEKDKDNKYKKNYVNDFKKIQDSKRSNSIDHKKNIESDSNKRKKDESDSREASKIKKTNKYKKK